MRALLAVSLGATVLLASCGGQGAPSVAAVCRVEPASNRVAEVQVPVPQTRPALCHLASASDVVAPSQADALPRELATLRPGIRVWQNRVLLYATEPCDGCPSSPFTVEQVEADHPEWILHDAEGNEVHPVDHPDWVLLDFGNTDYQAAWEKQAAIDLGKDGWAGVVITDAWNEPNWSSMPIDPQTGDAMTPDASSDYLAQALALVRNVLKTDGYSLVGELRPFEPPHRSQIASTDAITLDEGFIGRRAEDWEQLFDYFDVAVNAEVGSWVWDGEQRADNAERVYGYASYLLCEIGPLSAYAPPLGAGDDPLYRVNLGDPLGPPAQSGIAFVRGFADGAVAVNPGLVAQSISLPGYGDFELAPGGSVIMLHGKVFATG
jgi:putative glycosyl hydrolase-like family 15 (GHL15) protein